MRDNIRYYQFAIKASAGRLRAANAIYDKDSVDYYTVLKFCDKVLPPSEELQIVLPKEPGHRFIFLREKGRYILYPRNYGDNDRLKNYILVYGRKDYVSPVDYEVIHSFTEDKYLLKKVN